MVLKKHFEPKPLTISERFTFNRRQQDARESVADYVAELRRLTVHCAFGTFLDDALRDRFVCGLKSEAAQKKLLSEPDLTFQRAVEIAQNMELATAKAKQLQSHSGAAESQKSDQDICRVGLQSQPSVVSNSCYRCGKSNHHHTQGCKVSQLWQARPHSISLQTAKEIS